MKTNRTVVGVDTAKRVFQLHWVDMETGEIVDLRLMRAKFLEHFANRAPCLVAMEACGGSQHWARRIRELGHEVRLLPAKMVRPFVGGNKNDAHDARAIWTAVQQPGVKTVAIKSEEQQAILALHRMRQQLVPGARPMAAASLGGKNRPSGSKISDSPRHPAGAERKGRHRLHDRRTMNRHADEDRIAGELSAIPGLTRGELIGLWEKAHGRPPPKGLSRRLLEYGAAYRVQVKAFGGLKPMVRRKLRAGAVSGERTSKSTPAPCRGDKLAAAGGPILLRR